MQIRLESSGELLELFVEGVLDNDSSTHFRDTIEEAVHDGWHRILVDLSAVTYMSSAGVSAFLGSHAQLQKLNGLFGLCNLSKPVERVLSQTKLLDKLVCDPQIARQGASTGTMTRLSKTRVASEDGIDFQIYRQAAGAELRCTIYGDPSPVFRDQFEEQHCQQVSFSESAIGLGLGSFGDGFAASSSNFGEVLSVAGASAQSPPAGKGLPDYQIAQEDFIPDLQLLYGLKCEGEFSHLLRFSPTEISKPATLSRLVDQSLKLTECETAGFVILAECAGLVGTQLRKSPTQPVGHAANASTGKAIRFHFPEVRDWVSFSAEQIHRRSLVAIVGVARRASNSSECSELDPLLRPFDETGQLLGHFHAAVFPYRPLKKRTLDLKRSIRDLFESGSIQDVLHLLRDDRPVSGAGESELVSGGCWISPISSDIRRES